MSPLIALSGLDREDETLHTASGRGGRPVADMEPDLANGMDWMARNSAQLRLSVRVATASLAAYVLCHLLNLAQAQWAVLTAIIVMQASVGASLKAMIDRFLGSLGGAVWGVGVSLSLHHTGFAPLGVALAVAIAPLALLAALKPAFRVAPVTATILLLSPTLQTLGPVASAIQRMLEIGVGSLIALAVSLLVLPARAHGALAQAAGQALGAMSDLTAVLPRGLAGQGDPGAVQAAHDRIRAAIGNAEAAADEVLRERSSYLTSAPDPAPLCRNLRRLRHDLAIVGRAIPQPLPGAAGEALSASTTALCLAISRFFREVADAFTGGQPPPPLAELDAAFAVQAAAMTEQRRIGATRALPDEALGRVFGLSFALEQLHRDLQDLVDRGGELVREAEPAAAAPTDQPLTEA
jgi:uncharacterized membrane protein YccC